MSARARAWALAWISLTVVRTGTAEAAKVWDPGPAITFVMTGNDDPIAPSNIGDNGLQTRTFYIAEYWDEDSWISPDESEPTYSGTERDEGLGAVDIDYHTDAPTPGGLEPDGDAFVYTAPSVGGIFTVRFTATDSRQTVPEGDSGNRHDPDNNDYWWEGVEGGG